ncbi:uncharacterized protein LOC110434714 [Sorghum bicolor]|uniref:uncharacterized protein LOC110434714 n=1 Tax=Sorghum bicolor TaxID=4558 RepID=UPI000B426538|nr:uncharacterized protein LOC110434714 [Sorghum bicolor]|eukprot:XP_021315095.1 uncharacterized protein LOC110434714 [Sorghum bicolor]
MSTLTYIVLDFRDLLIRDLLMRQSSSQTGYSTRCLLLFPIESATDIPSCHTGNKEPLASTPRNQPYSQVTVMKLLRNSELHHGEILMTTNQVGNQTAVTGKQTKQSYVGHHMNEKKE